MATYAIQLANQPIRSSNEYALMLRITVDRLHARLKLIYSVSKVDFNPSTRNGSFIRSGHPNHTKINRYLARIIQQAKLAEEEIEKRGKLVTAASIKEEMSRPKSSSIFHFMEENIEQLQKIGSIGTYKKYKVILKTLKDYSGRKDLKFGEIDAKFLNGLQTWLLEDGKTLTTVHGYLSKIRSVFNKAISEEVIELQESPFFTYRFKQGKPNKDRLTIQEIISISNLDLLNKGRINDVRNTFLFSFYTAGMRVSDVLLLKWSSIKDGRLEYKMYKTGTNLSMQLVPKALEIIDYYESRDGRTGFVFPFLDVRRNLNDPNILHNQIGAKTALMNKYLKEIAQLAEIEKKITTHSARHSFADIARKEVDLYDLSKSLGHQDIKVTQAYIAPFDTEAVDNAVEKVSLRANSELNEE